MTAKANKAIVRRFFEEVWNKGDLNVIGEVCALEHYQEDPMIGPTRVSGMREALDLEVRVYRSFFPDLQFTVEEIVAEGDTVIARWVARGTHAGTRRLGFGVSDGEDIQPTGKQITAQGISISRIADGKIREHAQHWSPLSLLEALALVSGKVSPTALMEHLGYRSEAAVPPEELQPVS